MLGVGFGLSVSQSDVKPLVLDVSLLATEALTTSETGQGLRFSSETLTTVERIMPDKNLFIPTEVASLRAGFEELPRERFVSSLTTPSELNDWMARWRAKVESTGTDHARKSAEGKLEGDVLLLVSVESSGTVRNVRVLASSGNPSLDDMARAIALNSGPFEPLPDALIEKTNILHITRTWRFGASSFGGVQ